MAFAKREPSAAARLACAAGCLTACCVMLVWGGGCTAADKLQTSVADYAPTAKPHPFLLFTADEAAALAKRKEADPLLAECWTRLERTAGAADPTRRWARQLEARALLWQLQGDEAMAARAISQMRSALKREDPAEYYRRSNFHNHAVPLRALALGWDWLHGKMTAAERAEMLPALERWCRVALEHTEKQWWRDGSYNVGAIPVSGIGLLATAIAPDSSDPHVQTCRREATRRIGQNFFPRSWKPSGICWEGPNYAIVGLRYASIFAEALRRTGGPDLMGQSGAIRAMDYLMYQWMPQGGCSPIGDNTSYGRRTFAAEYLLGLARTGDPAGLWTWRECTERRRLDPLITYLWYPLGAPTRSPAEAGLPTSKYFEVTQNRAGYVFSRARWGDPKAAFFSFVTRFEACNHEHYDMHSFLLGAFGTEFATHRSLYPYGHEHHGVDFEHNTVIFDGGGWPAHDKSNSAGDDDSTDGLLVGLALGPFADYVRGDGKWSYRDNTVPNSDPAIRAERACLFVKAGATPYVLIVDDLHYRSDQHDYDWLWHAPDLPISGAGTLADPLVISASGGRCALRFIHPAKPALTVKPAEQLTRNRSGKQLQRIAVKQRGVRVAYVALATLEKDAASAPAVATAAVKSSNPSAGAVTIKLPGGLVDHIAWQSEEDRLQAGSRLSAGQLQTDALLAMVRVKGTKVVGYVLGEGTYLRWSDKTLVRSEQSVCVSAGPDGVKVFGRLRTRKGLPPLKPTGVQAARPGRP